MTLPTSHLLLHQHVRPGPRRRRAWTPVALGAVCALAGCSSALPGAAAPFTSATTAAAPAAAAPGTAAGSAAQPTPAVAGPLAAAVPAAAVGGPPPPPVAELDFTGAGRPNAPAAVHLRFDIVALARRGDLLELSTRITNEQAHTKAADGTPADISWDITGFQAADRPDIHQPIGSDTFSGVSLIDGVGRKRYLVAADAARRCACSSYTDSLDGGQSVALSAVFAAPLTTTTKLDVIVPTIGTFRDVPIS